VATDANIREYLLGRLDSDSELVERIDEQLLTDPELSMTIDVVEDEIIEDYLEGSLNAQDRRAVEGHFLRPPERQRKLKTARLFSRYVQEESRKVNATRPSAARSLFAVLRGGRLLPAFRTCAEIAAALVFVITILNLVNQRRELNLAMSQIRQQLNQERELSAFANQELQHALDSLQPAIAMLNLVRPGLQRGEVELPEAKLTSGTKALHIEVALLSSANGKYRVQLRHKGEMVWSRDGVDAVPVPGGAILKLDVPAHVLTQGKCELAITSSGTGTISYWFSISKIK